MLKIFPQQKFTDDKNVKSCEVFSILSNLNPFSHSIFSYSKWYSLPKPRRFQFNENYDNPWSSFKVTTVTIPHFLAGWWGGKYFIFPNSKDSGSRADTYYEFSKKRYQKMCLSHTLALKKFTPFDITRSYTLKMNEGTKNGYFFLGLKFWMVWYHMRISFHKLFYFT